MEYTAPAVTELGSFAQLTLAKEIGGPSDGTFTTGPFGDQFDLTTVS
jgi:hypothetical protein